MERVKTKFKKEKYLEGKRKAKKAIYQTKCEVERGRSSDVSGRDDRRYLFKIAKKMVKGNQFIYVVLTVSDEGKKIALKSYHEEILN